MISPIVRLIRLGVLLALLFPARLVAAQGSASFDSVRIEIWPEYDRPAALVLINVQLDPAVPLPASLSLPIPAAAGGPHAVAVRASDGSLVDVEYTTAASGASLLVTLTTDSAEVWLEYYDPALRISGEQRTYDFRWQPGYAADQVAVRVQQPAGARTLSATPTLAPLGVADDGLTYYSADLGALPADGQVQLQLSYLKTGSALTVDTSAAADGSTAAGAPAPAGGGQLTLVFIGAALLGVALVVGGVRVYLRSRPAAAPAQASRRARPPRRRAASRPAPPAAPETGPARFCTQCGQALQPGDRFCRGCGTPTRGGK